MFAPIRKMSLRNVAVAVTLAMALSACGTLQVLTSSTSNPITRDRLDQIEAVVQVGFAGLNTYRRSCLGGFADVHCRANVRAIQVYTRQVPPLLTQLRAFVKNNDQVNAVVVYQQLTQLLDKAKGVYAAGLAQGGK